MRQRFPGTARPPGPHHSPADAQPDRRKPVLSDFFCRRPGGSRSAGRGGCKFPASGKGVTISWGRCEKEHGTPGKNHTFPNIRPRNPRRVCLPVPRRLLPYTRRASPVPIASELAFRTSEGRLLYRSHSNPHFVHQRGLSCTKVRGLAVDDERRDNGGFLPSRVRRAGSAVFTRHGGAGSESERSPPAARGKPPERQYRIRTGFGENRATWVMHVGKISRGAARRMGAGR